MLPRVTKLLNLHAERHVSCHWGVPKVSFTHEPPSTTEPEQINCLALTMSLVFSGPEWLRAGFGSDARSELGCFFLISVQHFLSRNATVETESFKTPSPPQLPALPVTCTCSETGSSFSHMICLSHTDRGCVTPSREGSTD